MKEDQRRLFSQVHQILQGPTPIHDRQGRVVGIEEVNGSRQCIGGNPLTESLLRHVKPCGGNESGPMQERRSMGRCIRGENGEALVRDLSSWARVLAKALRRMAIISNRISSN